MKLYAEKTTRDGKPSWAMEPESRETLTRWLSRVKDGTRLEVDVARYREPQSDAQRGYFHACLTMYLKDQGIHPTAANIEQYKAALVEAVFGKDRGPDGMAVPFRTRDFSVAQYAELIDGAAAFLAGDPWCWVWPDPEHVGFRREDMQRQRSTDDG